MTPVERAEWAEVYRRGLLEDTVPFWLMHGLDREHGGVLTSLDHDGTIVDTDKSVWAQGRCAWLFATLAHQVGGEDEWLEAALSCARFLEAHAFDDDGRMLFLLTRDGRPLRKRRYVFSEAFAAMGLAACARATRRDDLSERAIRCFERFALEAYTPGRIPPKVDPATRPMIGLGPWMIGLNVAQELRSTIGWDAAEGWIDRCLETIEQRFVRRDRQVVLEVAGPNGEILDHFEGRTLNPGHAIEGAWFVLLEAAHRQDEALKSLGCDMLDWMWRRGWDEEHGGLYYFRDLDDKPVQEYWHDMKFWWPHCEAILATLLASLLTGEERYARWHRKVDAWAHDHFADPEHGEWFGYLHRDGRLSTTLKGNHWKGPFHLPRMQWLAWRWLSKGPIAQVGQ